MGSGVFTLLGVFAAWKHEGNSWIVFSSIALAVIFFFVAAYRAWRGEHQKLEAEIAKRGRPEVVATWDNANQLLMVETLSDTPALNVEIQQVTLDRWTARFDPIGLLKKGSPQRVQCYVERDNANISKSFDWLVWITRAPEEVEARVLLNIRYDDSHGTVWVSDNELRLNGVSNSGQVFLLGIRKVT